MYSEHSAVYSEYEGTEVQGTMRRGVGQSDESCVGVTGEGEICVGNVGFPEEGKGKGVVTSNGIGSRDVGIGQVEGSRVVELAGSADQIGQSSRNFPKLLSCDVNIVSVAHELPTDDALSTFDATTCDSSALTTSATSRHTQPLSSLNY